MFVLIQEAYRQIEMEHNPALKKIRDEQMRDYDMSEEINKKATKYKSRRPENEDMFQDASEDLDPHMKH